MALGLRGLFKSSICAIACWTVVTWIPRVSFAFAKDSLAGAKAKASFERVESAGEVANGDLQACILAQDEGIKSAKKAERSELHYRKGYCALLHAVLAHDRGDFETAAKEFQTAGQTAKNAPIIQAMGSIARLADDRSNQSEVPILKDLEDAVSHMDCAKPGFAGKTACESVLSISRLWLGWQAVRANRLADARRQFEHVPSSPWNDWAAGLLALDSKQWSEAATAIEKAVRAWFEPEKAAGKSALNLLSPGPDRGALYARLGYANYMAGKFSAAIPALDVAIRERPSEPYWLFMRARAREELGNPREALSDFELAANVASSRDGAKADAYFYRGVMLYRRNNLKAAAREFSFAQNLPPGDIPAADITAWRTLVEARGDGCKTEVQALQSAGDAAGALFAKRELEDLEFNCRVAKAGTLGELLALDPALRKRYSGPGSEQDRQRIAEAYMKKGFLAEDQKEIDSAADAYRKALEWDPKATKARFNLAAIYVEEKKFDLAEKEYRALIAADPADHESQYWLAESILSQEPTPERTSEACAVLKEAVKTKDAEKKSLSIALTVMSNCPN